MTELTSTIMQMLHDEFFDLSDLSEAVRVALRLALAAALGGLLGYDREKQGKAAGLRTYMLVSMGSALCVLVPDLAGMALSDMSRVIQGVITGIGFLGAGAILKHQSKGEVEGLTTAAGIWMTAAIGIACGLGRSMTAIVSVLLAWAVLSLIPHPQPPSLPRSGKRDEPDE